MRSRPVGGQGRIASPSPTIPSTRRTGNTQPDGFTGLRLAAGVALLALPVVFLWAGALVSSWLAAVPPTLQTYPTALAARFFLASFLAFAVFFAISSATPKTAGALLMIVVMLGLAQLFARLFGIGIDLIGPSVDMITTWPGPLDVFGGRWMLIDF